MCDGNRDKKITPKELTDFMFMIIVNKKRNQKPLKSTNIS